MRKKYLDNVRWITVVLVVIYHVIYMYNGVTSFGVVGPFHENQIQDVYEYIVYPWFMLLLFVVSGISARFDLDQCDSKIFLKKRTRKLLVPSTIGLLVGGWILGYYNMLIGGAFEAFANVPKPFIFLIMCISGCGPLWYIQMLWVFCLLLLFIRKIEKDRFYHKCENVNIVTLLLLTLFIYGSAQILNTPIIVVYRFGIYGTGFLIGYFILSHEKVMECMEKNWILLTILFIIACFVFVKLYWGQPYPKHQVLNTVVCNIYAWFGTLGILAFLKKWGDFETAFSRWMCKKSWGLYIFHYLPIAMCGWYIKLYFPGIIPAIAYLLTTLAAFIGAFLLYELISRIPFLRWSLLGLKGERK